jgi:hypothetical protein
MRFMAAISEVVNAAIVVLMAQISTWIFGGHSYATILDSRPAAGSPQERNAASCDPRLKGIGCCKIKRVTGWYF